MGRRFSFTFICFCFIQSAIAQQNNQPARGTGIICGSGATHIGAITPDSIVVISGSTYLFTVDTPEDKGLVSTNISAKQFLLQLASQDGSKQTYKITDWNDNIKDEEKVETGDKLIVTSQNSKASKTYHIAVRLMALSGQLRLEKEKVTVNVATDLTLYFTAGQRSPNTTVRIYVPEGIDIAPDNTIVNVIGRGDVKLQDLATQSMGRLGTNYPYKKVGNFAVSKNAGGGSVLLFKHLDLRAANGTDLKITIQNVRLTKKGNYSFRVVYATAQPEVLTSAGIGTETAILTF